MAELGCIADDLTGATDLATALVSRGYRTLVRLGVPDSPADLGGDEVDAVVVALKTRTAPVAEAVAQSRSALRILQAAGARRFYFKYCSTFDSTPQGNIGPVADALRVDLEVPTAIVVPAFPAGGRTLYKGHLFVHGQLLGDSPMRNHPLTPMTDSNVLRLLRPQTAGTIELVDLQCVHRGAAAVHDRLTRDDAAALTVIDAVETADLETIASAAAQLLLLTGGSGLGAVLSPQGVATAAPCLAASARRLTPVAGFRAVLSGSLSAATRAQVTHAEAQLPHGTMVPYSGGLSHLDWVDQTAAWAVDRWGEAPDRPVMISSIALAEPNIAADDVERALGDLAVALVARGARQLIVAGGETSGRVMAALGVNSLRIGPELAPGVAWATAESNDGPLTVALKSGNFGHTDLFVHGWSLLGPVSFEKGDH